MILKLVEKNSFYFHKKCNSKETDDIEKILFCYLESIKNDASERHDAIRDRIIDIKNLNVSDSEIYELLVEVLNEAIER